MQEYRGPGSARGWDEPDDPWIVVAVEVILGNVISLRGSAVNSGTKLLLWWTKTQTSDDPVARSRSGGPLLRIKTHLKLRHA